MIETNKLQILVQINREMSEAVLKLQNTVLTGNAAEVEKVKASVLELQKKFSNALQKLK
jgi:hypothetical protein